jgi:hypothetical protein
MNAFTIKNLIRYSIMICCFTQAGAQSKWKPELIKMDKRFDAAIEISSIVYLQDTVYLASTVCESVYMGTIDHNSFKISAVKHLADCDYEGAAYHKGYFYFSDDKKDSVFRYRNTFGTQPSVYPIALNGNEGVNLPDNGFEGIAAINDTTFYILLENSKKGCSILYKGILKANKLQLLPGKQMIPGMRYCDLFYDNDSKTLYLLKTNKYDRRYMIDSLELDSITYNIKKAENPSGTITTNLVCDFSRYVNENDAYYDTNIEGLTMVDKNTFYIISDNCMGCSCGQIRPRHKTLFMRLTRTK